MTTLFHNYVAIQPVLHPPSRNMFTSEHLRELPQAITVSVTYCLFLLSFIKAIIKIILRTNNLWANFAVR